MKLWLSEKAQEQMCEQNAKATEVVDPAKAFRDAEKREQRQIKVKLKAAKIRARENARKADAELEEQFNALRDVEANIAGVESRITQGRSAYDQRCAKSAERLQKLQRELEKANMKMQKALRDLEKTRADVPEIISGMQELHRQRESKMRALCNGFLASEEAWKAEHLTNSARGKRNSGLRRAVKGIINRQEPTL